MKVKQVSTSSCETIYDVDGTRIRLSIITGGTPCLSFQDYSYSERYPVNRHQWSNEHWIKEIGLYIHQDPECIQGPDFSVLPETEKTVEKYLAINLPKKQLTEARFNALPVSSTIYSKRVRDREEHTMVRAKLSIEKCRLSCITLSSNAYCGRVEKKITLFDSWWVRAMAVINTIHDKYMSELGSWNLLTEDEYKAVVKILSEKTCPAVV